MPLGHIRQIDVENYNFMRNCARIKRQFIPPRGFDWPSVRKQMKELFNTTFPQKSEHLACCEGVRFLYACLPNTYWI